MSYYRTAAVSFGPPVTRVVKQLIIFTVGAFVLTYLPAVIFHWRFPPPLLGLRPFEVTRYFAIWELATYLFLHAGFFHIVFNLFALWMFGSDLERLWGPRRFLFFFFLTGVGAGLLNVLLEPSSIIATVGNSGAVYGVLLAYGLLFPDRPIFLWLIIPIKAKWFVAIIGVMAFIGSLSGPGSGISHLAHLGGMLFAFLYLRGGGLSYRMQLRYNEWRRARLRRKFEVYVRKHEKKDEAGRWIN
ncbi:MAG TPA: rhomboid family intramembrane serine protease [Terriglobia bacterium]|nr:rhomboid family intramembrane serine protease [Terriglobia bacterium]